MICLRVLGINFSVEFQLDVVGGLFGIGMAGKSEGGRLEVDFKGFVGDVGRRDCEEDVILFRFGR